MPKLFPSTKNWTPKEPVEAPDLKTSLETFRAALEAKVPDTSAAAPMDHEVLLVLGHAAVLSAGLPLLTKAQGREELAALEATRYAERPQEFAVAVDPYELGGALETIR